MKNTAFKKQFFYFTFLSLMAFSVIALPRVNIEHMTSVQGVPSVKVSNQTSLTLACYVAIDGYKRKFVLQAFGSSKWFSASSNQYKHSNFSTWCDALEFYPDYKKYI
ncbi:hypothetical protein ACPUVO_02740 [Pseudocolwellia sp. HL-MZ19]|uniref:hypothetical protein n=1 Tax=unclassified Pseudocolwellia TaxID=2848178 RepID=UPI003CF3741A